MSQTIWDTIIPTATSGTELATLLNDFKDATVSGFSGDTSRPANLQENGYWIKYNTPDNGLVSWMFYDGTNDIEIFQINKTAQSIILANADSEFIVVKSSDDTSGPVIKLRKNRVSGAQTLEGDTLGDIDFSGQDASEVEYVQARLRSVSVDDTSATEQGSDLEFYVTQQDGTALVKAMVLFNNQRLGLGVTSADKVIHASALDSSAGAKFEIAIDATTAPEVLLRKKRISGSGQTILSDEIGVFKGTSTDQNGAEIDSFSIKGVANVTHTSTDGGTNLLFQRVKGGAVALSTAITIDDDSVNIADDLEVAGSATISTDLTVTGDLTVNGTTTTVNTTNLDVTDANITVNDGGTQATADAQDAGLTVEMSDATDAVIGYDSTLVSKFKAGESGSESEIITSAGAQTITGKSVVTPSRLDVKQDTFANLTTYASSAANGQLCFATDTKQMYQVLDSALAAVGGGGAGSAATIDLTRAADLNAVGDIDLSGQNNDFDGGGTITASSLTLSETAGDLILEDKVIKYDPDANGQNDYFGFTKDIPQGLRGRYLKLSFEYRNGAVAADDDFRYCVKVKDGTLAGNLTYLDLPAQISTDKNSQKFNTVWYCPVDCTQIEHGIQNTVTTTTVEFYWDNIEISSNAFLEKSIVDSQTYTIEQAGSAMTERTSEWEFNLGTATIENTGTALIVAEDDSGNTRTKFTAQKDLTITSISAHAVVSNVGFGVVVRRYNSSDVLQESINGPQSSSGSVAAIGLASITMSSGDYLTIFCTSDIANGGSIASVSFHAQSETDAVYHATNTSDIENEFSARVDNAGSASIITENVSGWLDSASRIGAGVVTIDYTSLDLSAIPNIVATVADNNNYNVSVTSITTTSANVIVSDLSSTNTDQDFSVKLSKQSTDYRSPARSAITPLTETCFIKDVKSSGTDGGTFTSGSYQTRTLNTLENNCNWVSLSSNQFTLASGKYSIFATAPANKVNRHKIRIQNITDATTVAIGSAKNAGSGDSVVNDSDVFTVIELTSAKTFELQHRGFTTVAGSGFGISAAFGDNEVYAQVEITKLK